MYRYLLSIVFMGLLFTACNQETGTTHEFSANEVSGEDRVSVDDLPETSIEFAELTHDFGRIVEGEKVKHTFKFKNTGQAPLQVISVKPSCGCTTPSYSKEPVAPGEEGFIEVLFDSGGKQGAQKKTVQVFANTAPRVTIITFAGEVVEGQ